MTRTKISIPSLVRPGLDFGSKVGGVVDGIEDLARALTELKASSDDMTVVEMAGAYAFSGIKVTLSAPLTLNPGGFILFDTTVFAAGGWVRTGDTIVVPTGVTRVLISAVIQWAASSVGNRDADLIKQGGGATAFSRIRATVAGESSMFISSGIIEAVAGEIIQLRAQQDTGGNLDLLSGVTYLSAYALG